MIIPAIDLGLMADHLSVHEGVIAKLKFYRTKVHHLELKSIIEEQLSMMRQHIRVMLTLIYPHQNENPYTSNDRGDRDKNENDEDGVLKDKHIALEAHATANFMAQNNFISAIMMKDSNVKHVHFNMAWQQVYISGKYEHFIRNMGWSKPPMASAQEQFRTFQLNQHLLKE